MVNALDVKTLTEALEEIERIATIHSQALTPQVDGLNEPFVTKRIKIVNHGEPPLSAKETVAWVDKYRFECPVYATKQPHD